MFIDESSDLFFAVRTDGPSLSNYFSTWFRPSEPRPGNCSTRGYKHPTPNGVSSSLYY